MEKRLIIALCILIISACEFVEEEKVNEMIEEEVTEEVEESEEIIEYEEEIEKLHWGHMPVTYFITNKEECGDYEARKIRRAFDAIENATNSVVNFKEIDEDIADIDVTCSFIEDCYEYKVDIRREEGVVYRYEIICEYAKGIAQIMWVRGSEILKAEIEMIGLAGFAETTGRGASGFYIGSCGHPTTEIHEILHTFGYGHSDDPSSIMYFAEDSVGYTLQEQGACVGKRKDIDEEIVEDLIDIYSRLE